MDETTNDAQLPLELTLQQAADRLNVSRQYLVRLLEADAIPITSLAATAASAPWTS